MALYFQSLQKSPLIYPTLKLSGQGLHLVGMIIQLQCLSPLWELQTLCYEWMLWLILLNRHYKILKNLFQHLMLNKHTLERWFYKTDWLKIFWQLHKEELVSSFILSAVHIYQIWALMLLILLDTWTRWLGPWILLKPQLPHFGRC